MKLGAMEAVAWSLEGSPRVDRSLRSGTSQSESHNKGTLGVPEG